MNKAITDGIVFQPLAFAAGLGVWSSGDGTPGSDTYATSGTGVFVSADQDFGGCLEMQKTQTITRLRYMGETPVLPGCYLRVSARVKAVAGPLPAVRISGYPGAAGGGVVAGLPQFAAATQLTTYGEVVEISAIIGTGDRTGVDLVWLGAAFGHLGIELTGPSGGLVRVDDIDIEDITVAFQRDMMATVDVTDFGAIGDDSTDCAAAFEAADFAAQGRTILVPDGTFRLAQDVTLENPVRFQGRVTQAADKRFILQKDYHFESYLDAFKDEELAFQKAYQALLNFSDHDSLDLRGRRISLTAPLDMQACDPARTTFATRRVVRNGQIEAVGGPAWTPDAQTSVASYDAGDALRLTNVTNIANIAVGSLITGAGVGREVYVRERNVGAQTITLSKPLYDPAGSQTYTFTRFKYLLDFSGYADLSKFVLDDIEFQCNGHASGLLLAPSGLTFHLRDCFVTKPADRGLTSPGNGCQGMMIDRCQFLSNEQSLAVSARTTVAFNANANDVKIRDNRIALFRHFCVLAGKGSLITGNHWFHGDSEPEGVRLGGIIITTPNCKSVITGNYSDNNFIEWTNEHEADPAQGSQFSFGGLTVTGNIFTASDVIDSFNFIVIKPYGPGHFVHGFSVIGNVFRSVNGNIDRVEHVDTTFADLEFQRMRMIQFSGNTFHGVNQEVFNPANLTHTQNTASNSWVAESEPYLPFLGRARFVDGVMPDGDVTSASGGNIRQFPGVEAGYGPDKRQVRFNWNNPVQGTLRFQVRMDNPI